MKKETKRIALSGLMVSVMLVLGYVESLIPLGSAVPGIKIGLANSVLLYAIYVLGAKQAFVLMIVKVLLSGLTFGGVNAMMYSLAGGVLSMAAMLIVRRVPGTGILGVSIAGAAMHNLGQVLLAMIVLQTDKLLYYMAILVLVGIGTGFLTGVVAHAVLRVQGFRPDGDQDRA